MPTCQLRSIGPELPNASDQVQEEEQAERAHIHEGLVEHIQLGVAPTKSSEKFVSTTLSPYHYTHGHQAQEKHQGRTSGPPVWNFEVEHLAILQGLDTIARILPRVALPLLL